MFAEDVKGSICTFYSLAVFDALLHQFCCATSTLTNVPYFPMGETRPLVLSLFEFCIFA